jgi:hypothetical protein
VGEQVLHRLRAVIDEGSEARRERLRERLLAKLGDKGWIGQELLAARSVRLLGYLREPKLVSKILPFMAVKQPLTVRLSAIAALRRPLAASKRADRALDKLLAAADEAAPQLGRAAVETLRGARLGEAQLPRLRELLAGRHAEVRAWAVEALGRLGGAEAVAALIRCLDGDDPATRDVSLAALRRMEDIGPALVVQLGKVVDDPEALARSCRLLSRHGGELKAAGRRKVSALAERALDEAHPAAPTLLELFASVDPAGHAALLLARAAKHRRAKRYGEALALFATLDAAEQLDDGARYSALVCGLLATADKKALARASRANPVLRQATELAAAGVDISVKLARERSLSAEDLFYLGFNLVESGDDDERELGAALLQQVVTKSPRSKLGKSAKNKLKLSGLG